MEKILVVDHEKCTGCRLCEMVCSVKHVGVNNPARSRIHVIKWPREGFELPMLCQQCEKAPCISVCPKGALSRDPLLARVTLNYDLCIGCKMCVVACPFGGMGVDVVAHQVIKCDQCDGDPTCVRFCNPGALQFLPASSVNLNKKRDAGLKFSEVMRKSFTARL
ncbi:MAG: 4Fe-4S dicluster domain-containing protein [Chloroflexi bacterium]|nr:4Fe-4S dicluster domain-containing protein [Chloroflexota bacterium]